MQQPASPDAPHLERAQAFDRFVSAYIAAMLWSSNDESDDNGGQPFDANYSADDFSVEARAQINRECAAFFDEHNELIESPETLDGIRFPGDVFEQAGHDFWLTRAGHGVGFWDGDWPEPAASILTKACKQAGNRDVYLGDDRSIYLSPSDEK